MNLTNSFYVVDDRRIWVIAEALRRGVSYDHIFEITKIDRWFIDKIAILVEMENRLKTEELYCRVIKRSKTYRIPLIMLSQDLQERMKKISNRCVMITES